MEVICSFCLRNRDEVERMIKGENAHICGECVDLCQKQLDQIKLDPSLSPSITTEESTSTEEALLPSPAVVKRALDNYVIGQEQVKKCLSVAIYNHYKRRKYRDVSDAVELSKSNILLIGPTGSGKTLLAQTMARVLDVPLVVVDATTLTEAGYVGEDVENIVQRLVQRCDYDMEKVEQGIIYIDEIDKIARKSENLSITRDVSGEGVQQALLKLIEGTVASVPPHGGRKHPHQDYVQVDTTEILFICGGAFGGLSDIVNRRCKRTLIGFDSTATEAKNKQTLATQGVLPEDLIAYGLIPELVGRLPILGILDELDEAALSRILTHPRNALTRQYQEIFAMDGVELCFTDSGIRAIVGRAQQRRAGARGLRAVLEEILMDTMFVLPDMKTVTRVDIDASAVNNNRPLLIMKGGTKKRMAVKDVA